MRALYEKWIENRDTPASRKYLIDTYNYLTSQRMIRLINDLKSVYLIPPDYVKPKQMDDLRQIHGRIQALYPAIFSDQAKVGDVDWDLNKISEDLQSCIKGVIYNLEKGSDHVFYWISRLCDFRKKDGKPDYRHLESVWAVLYRFIGGTNSMNVCGKHLCSGIFLQKNDT